MTANKWFTSSYSSGNGQCVQVKHQKDDTLVRDSAHPNQALLSFPAKEWHAFLDGLGGFTPTGDHSA